MQGKKSTARRDKLISLQARARNIWNRFQYFAVQPNQKPKYFMTFPYAYMNGKLHLGHAFSLTKCDFNAWYKRLCGFNVLFPFGYHCTGMPISAASMKLQQQLKQYGNPPKGPQGWKGQYHILTQMGIKEEQIANFTDPVHWVRYFPPLSKKHLTEYGAHVDHQRSFITTYLNPYYNSFIQWQFNILKEKGYINFGKRPSIYCPKDQQMCADHDRKEGQGVVPQQFTLIKLRVLQLNETMKKSLGDRKVFLVAATLRPQTMYGQTSCFLLPTGQYCAVQMKNDQVFICSQRSARNMAYQFMTKENKKVQIITKFKGQELMGLPLSGPLAVHKRIYTLPMMTISMKKGTGVVSCVPSDSPDDWMAISDLRNKQKLREKFNITKEMVDLQPVPIIWIQSYKSDVTAVKVCQQMKIKSQNERQLLDKAKQQCYKKGFHEGIMIVGNFKDKKVAEAKNLVRQQLIDLGQAIQYYQPNGVVISRSDDECVVSHCQQWYINYGQEQWKKKVLNHVMTNFHCNSDILKKDLIYTIDWLKEWGCSRSFGLGTKLPFDKQYLIESLSDSTIYMAYYTISHFLQGNLDGSQVGLLGIRHEDITPDFWDYIFLGKQYTSNKVPMSKLKTMRDSFLYWYPMDIRCSGKDLIKNHLTMSLFNHVAIWQNEPDKWPRGFYCNGFINVDGEKMSKSKGNFKTLQNILTQYGADSARLACALAGDSINDANFTVQTANAAILQLSTFEMYMSKVLQHIGTYRSPDNKDKESQYFDTVFQNQMEQQINKVKQSYENMIYRDVVKYGFHDFVGLKDYYILNCDAHKPRRDLIERYIFLQLIFLYPICPHFCEVSYIDYFLTITKGEQPSRLGSCLFPKARQQINYGAIRSHQYYVKFMVQMRESLKKVSKPKKGQVPKYNKAIIIYRDKFQPYQLQILKLLSTCIENGEIRADWRNDVKIDNKDQKTRALMFGSFVSGQFKTMGKDALSDVLPYDERKTLQMFYTNIKKELNLDIEILQIENAPKKQNKGWQSTLNSVTPGNPTVIFE